MFFHEKLLTFLTFSSMLAAMAIPSFAASNVALIPGTGDGLMAICDYVCDYDRYDVEGTGKTYNTEMENINVKLTVTGRSGVRTETGNDRNCFRVTIYEGRLDKDITARTDVTGIYNGKKYIASQEIDLP